jgi:amino acid transporter
VHPTKRFPHISLLALGAAAFAFSLLFRLFFVIRAILAMRCLIQFIGQAVGLIALRRRWPREKFPFRMWLYPIPALIAILGWAAIFVSTGIRLMAGALIFTLVGAIVYLARARALRQWPFQEAAA